jgi:hypothetical protein
MGIREKLNDKPWLGAVVGGGALAVGALFIAVQLSSGGGGGAPDAAFFSVDDGQTWFEGDASKIPPFQHEGKEAVIAHVFECNGKRFVNHLERYTPQGRKLMEDATAATKAGKPLPPATGSSSPEIKKPGAKEWVSAGNYAKAGPILQAKCPDGKGEAMPVMP